MRIPPIGLRQKREGIHFKNTLSRNKTGSDLPGKNVFNISSC